MPTDVPPPADPPATDRGAGLMFVFGLRHSGIAAIAAALHGTAGWCSSATSFLPQLVYATRWHGVDAEYDAFAARSALESFLCRLPDGHSRHDEAIRAFAGVMYGALCASSAATRILDHTPRLVCVAADLARLFPQARALFVLRHPLRVMRDTLHIDCGGNAPSLKLAGGIYRELVEGPRWLVAGLSAWGERAIVLDRDLAAIAPQDSARSLADALDSPAAGPALAAALAPVASSDSDADGPATAPGAATLAGLLAAAWCLPSDADRRAAFDHLSAAADFAQGYVDLVGAETLQQLGCAADALSVQAACWLSADSARAFATPLPMTTDAQTATDVAATGAAAHFTELSAAAQDALERGDANAAEALLATLARRDAARSNALEDLAVIYWNAGLHDDAVAVLQMALRRDPDASAAVGQLAQMLAALGRTQEAQRLIGHALLRLPQHAAVLAPLLDSLAPA